MSTNRMEASGTMGRMDVAPARRSSSSRMLVLVVERDPHVRELEAHFLGQAGFAVEFAVDGLLAHQRAQELLPQIVITEILVPKLDGLALCRQLKADPATRNIAILVFSMLAASVRAREAGADAFLMKPLAENRLINAVRELLAWHTDAAAKESA